MHRKGSGHDEQLRVRVEAGRREIPLRKGVSHVDTTVAQQPHAAIGELNNVHTPNCPASFGISDSAPKVRRAVADAERWAAQ
jgi:hypothetical protein